ncbi:MULTISPECIES: hypothetical protein [Planktothricoides]|uniref:Uncharacterized protein n=2 Tax=Planktothricoides raciborskii TaxID=132608 RepID=A0AAU8JBC5_9CYAN|nr:MULTISPECIES: hypothetical protein [Planktothricoides]KOR35726.1 hypothetical protein AM228_16925 [Planktothricoides sp. SR001]MBD2545771.1 hypothetical protein [Planktothricoides raciborskii FACHB-1370]MBD2584008.1 hypothetical protein [Planktothricoides raciborskii FACHB-1261]
MAENRSWVRAKHSGNYVNGENPELTARRRSLLEEYALPLQRKTDLGFGQSIRVIMLTVKTEN